MITNQLLIIYFALEIMHTDSTIFRLRRTVPKHHIQRRAKMAMSWGWSQWTRWDCPVTCGGGIARRIRTCRNRQKGCYGPSQETQPCAEIQCPIGAPPQLMEEADRQIQATTYSFQVPKGETVTFDCQGNLRSSITAYYRNAKPFWYHNHEVYEPDNERTSITDTMNLLIVSALPTDNGVWACEILLSENAPLVTSVNTLAVQNDEPDIVVTEGEPLTLPCYGPYLSKYFPSKKATQWFHNSNLVKQMDDAQQELAMKESVITDGGIWVCKVIEKDASLRRSPKSWATNAVRVKILPRESSVGSDYKEDSKGGSSSRSGGSGKKARKTTSPIVIIIVIVIALLVISIYCCFRTRRKKSAEKGKKGGKKRKPIDLEKGDRRVKPKKDKTKAKPGDKAEKKKPKKKTPESDRRPGNKSPESGDSEKSSKRKEKLRDSERDRPKRKSPKRKNFKKK